MSTTAARSETPGPADPLGALIARVTVAGAAEGPLAGRSFVVKDLYDVAGTITGCGSPDWARTHGPAETHAPVVAALLAAGATLTGKAHTDELAFSLIGANAHYGTPLNSADPRRVPGGSSSGSAAAVAGGIADFAIGSDTGGSVRTPASICGIFGLRVSHGRVSLAGAMPFAPSLDTCGWFARDAATLARVGAALGLTRPPLAPGALLLPVDAWALASPATVEALGPALARLAQRFGPLRPIVMAPEGLAAWAEVLRVRQGFEIWQTLGGWIEAAEPAFGPGVRERFGFARTVTAAQASEAAAMRETIGARMAGLLAGGAVMALPTTPEPGPFRDADEATLAAFRVRAMALLSPAGLARLPQLSMPAGLVDGGPVGLSLVGARGTDEELLAMADALG